jgi:hypothetical protein
MALRVVLTFVEVGRESHCKHCLVACPLPTLSSDLRRKAEAGR